MNVAGARVLVVGGVRRLGAVVAHDLAAHGAAVAVSTRRPDGAAQGWAGALRAAGAPAAAVLGGDVREPRAVRDLVDAAAAALGGLDAVVYAASGPFAPQRPEDLDEAGWEAVFSVVARGFFFTAVAARCRFVGDGHGGVVVALTDTLGIHPWAAFAAHGAAKAAQIHLVRSLARAWHDEGVRVCGVAPGPVDLADDEHREATLRAAARMQGGGQRPALVAAADVAAAVRLCLGAESLTGTNVIVDGGALLAG